MIIIFLFIPLVSSNAVFPLLTKPVRLGEHRSWGQLAKSDMKPRKSEETGDIGIHKFNVQVETLEEPQVKVTEGQSPVDVLKSLRRELLTLKSKTQAQDDAKVNKRNARKEDNILFNDYDYSEEYEEEPSWTPVGNGRVKILPLRFGEFKINMIHSNTNIIIIIQDHSMTRECSG